MFVDIWEIEGFIISAVQHYREEVSALLVVEYLEDLYERIHQNQDRVALSEIVFLSEIRLAGWMPSDKAEQETQKLIQRLHINIPKFGEELPSEITEGM